MEVVNRAPCRPTVSMFHRLATVVGVVDPSMLPQSGRVVLVMLRDGRQLDGELIVLTDRFEVAGTVFQPSEIAEIDDLN